MGFSQGNRFRLPFSLGRNYYFMRKNPPKTNANKPTNTPNRNVVIYHAKNGAIELKGDFNHETVWATQADIVKLFAVDQSVVSRHIRNIFADGEIDQKSNMQKMHNANSDKPILLYSMDVILAVGYRTNSKVAIEFRQWATKTLRSYIIDGFAVNKKRIASNYTQFLKVVEDIKKFLPVGTPVEPGDAVELVTLFADTWLSLDAYDKDALPVGKLTKKKVELTAKLFGANLVKLRSELLRKNEATDIFGMERVPGSVAGIIGNVMQTFGDKELYPKCAREGGAFAVFYGEESSFY